MAEEVVFRDVMKAVYDYAATADDELAMKEDQLLYLLGNLDDDWAKVQVHVPLDALSEAEPAAGLVPSAYIEPAPPLYRAVALYDYEPNGEGEIFMKENEKLSVYLKEDEWILVKIDRKGTVSQPAIGYVPANYIEEGEGDGEASAQAQSSSKSSTNGTPQNHNRGQSKDILGRPYLEKPKPTNTRIWRDRSGQFKVEAQFLGIHNNKIRLHKANGVIIEVPEEKMSAADMAFIRKPNQNPTSLTFPWGEDDVLLGTLANRRSTQGPPSSSRPAAPLQRKSHVDWLEFFLNSGCDIDDCTRYASTFERKQIDEAILPDVKPETLRGLNLREGDIIRVMKQIEQRGWKVASPRSADPKVQEQMKKDAELAARLQEEEYGRKTAPRSRTASPGLFAAPPVQPAAAPQPVAPSSGSSTSSYNPSFNQPLQPSISPLLANPTGFAPSASPFQNPPSATPPDNNSPANVFAAMKAGSFVNSVAPQSSDKSDALRPQPAGWNALRAGVQPQQTGFNPGFGAGSQPGAIFGQQPGFQQPMQDRYDALRPQPTTSLPTAGATPSFLTSQPTGYNPSFNPAPPPPVDSFDDPWLPRPTSDANKPAPTPTVATPYTTPESPATKLAPRVTTGSGKWVKFVTVVPGQHARFRIHDDMPPICGGFSDVWRCDARFSDGRVIAAAMKKFRAVRIARDADANTVTNKLLKRLTKELDIWMTLQHPRISPLLGFALEDDLCIISPWYTNGNVTEYIDRHPEADKIKLVFDVACGLAYLHARVPLVVHGDMKADNVLVDDAGNAVIIDFGLSAIAEEDPNWGTSLATTSSLQDAGNARWMAPELLMEEDCTRSPSTDVYSFGCVALQIYTGEIPFKDVPAFRIIPVLYQGQKPLAKREDTQLSSPSLDWFYNLLVSCWDKDPMARPSMVNVESKLRMRVCSGGASGNGVFAT